MLLWVLYVRCGETVAKEGGGGIRHGDVRRGELKNVEILDKEKLNPQGNIVSHGQTANSKAQRKHSVSSDSTVQGQSGKTGFIL